MVFPEDTSDEEDTKKFRAQRKKQFLTYSCPKALEENPITTHEALRDFLLSKGETDRFSIGKELHQDGGVHWHAYFEQEVDTVDCRYFDFLGVHPNWKTGVYARHVKYTQKFGEFIQEGCEGKVDHFAEAFKKRKSGEAIEYLYEHEPKHMAINGHNIERNVRRRLDAAKFEYRPYYGPYQFQAPADWDCDTQTLLITGEVGIGKTQWARYYAEHHGGYFYCKDSLECMKHYKGESWIIYDDIKVGKYNFDCWAGVFDVADGGSISQRYADIQIKPGVKKIWLQNPTVQIKDAYRRVLNGRRSYEVDYF